MTTETFKKAIELKAIIDYHQGLKTALENALEGTMFVHFVIDDNTFFLSTSRTEEKEQRMLLETFLNVIKINLEIYENRFAKLS